MHKHLSLQLNGPSNALPTPPSTQNAVSSGTSPSTQPPTTGSSSTDANIQGTSRATPSQPLQAAMQRPVPQSRQQLVQQQAATVALPAGPTAPHAQNPPPAQPADEITALRARIAELEHISAHGNQLPARATVPHQALVADPTAVSHIRANLASAKDEPKKLALPVLQPGHKVSALSLPIPTKVEEAFKLYHYVPYTALTHAVRSKAHLRGEDSSFVFTQDGLTAKGLDHSSKLSIVTVDWIGAAKAAEERTLHYWGADRASALMSHHLVVLDIGRMHGWSVTMHYDVQQWELAHANHEHNLAGLDVAALTIANNKVASSISFAVHLNTPTKCSAPSDFASSPRKKSHTFASNHCFWCGAHGHLPADCVANTTIAGRPVVALATGARSKHALATASGSTTASIGPIALIAPSEPDARIPTPAACVGSRLTEPGVAKLMDDPRTVVTPLDHL
ncbi:hypothetical protein EDD22DRAFT_1015281 [Suillus occidentalis]|nr:hypothetical protein EDD22DRAFT_1015281 [Suillus occidentalis]